ncbi:response regulator [Streptomyces sp. NPDC048255]|uniref:response regulator n=1 Tax=Streptomyces sp. NPDC048255 TaxID=3154713 RepID=UPI0033C5CB6A
MSGGTGHRIIRVLLAADGHLMRRTLGDLLALEGDLRVVAEAESGSQALAMARAHRPDVAVLDIGDTGRPGPDGVQVAAALRDDLPDCRTVIITESGRSGRLEQCLSAGARGVASRSTPAEQLVAAIRIVHSGGRYVHPELVVEAIVSESAT